MIFSKLKYNKMSLNKVKTDKGIIEFYLSKKRNMKSIRLRVKADLKVYVSAPYSVDLQFIKDFVSQKDDWIFNKIEEYKKLNQNKKIRDKENQNYILYLGQKYKKEIILSDKENVILNDKKAKIYVKNIDRADVVIQKWLKNQINIVFSERVDKMSECIYKFGLKKPNMKFRKMKARWGSCFHSRGLIILNSELIKKPISCIDYVIMHELCHLKFNDHSTDFYNFLNVLMPDWEKRKNMLNKL